MSDDFNRAVIDFLQLLPIMNAPRPTSNRYRQILIASFLSSTSLLALQPALAVPAGAGTVIENEATAQYTDSADNTTANIVSDKVTVTVAEVAGISISTPVITGTLYPGSTVNYEFTIRNDGNDQTQFFVPGAPSISTVNGTSVTAGTLQILAYNSDGVAANEVDLKTAGVGVSVPASGGTTGTVLAAKSGINGGSVAPGGYIKVRVPVTIPATATASQAIIVTLGNTVGQSTTTTSNLPYVVGANGTNGSGTNDVYTQDNSGTANGDAVATNPINGDTTLHRQEASASGTTAVVIPKITISGKVWDDADGSGNLNDFTGINNGTEAGTVITPPLYAILVRDNKVVASVAVSATATTKGEYSFTNIDGFQSGLSVILSTTAGTVNTAPPTAVLPTNWAKTTQISRPLADTTSLAVTGIDFGIEQLPVAVDGTASGGANPTGTTSFPVPATVFTNSTDADATDNKPTAYLITAFPTSATSLTIGATTYYPTTAAATAGGGTLFPVAGVEILATALAGGVSVDPIDGTVIVTIPFKAKDAAGEFSTNTANATIDFTALSISGTVWNDKDKSGATGTIFTLTPLETGTDAVFGTNSKAIKAVLVDTTVTASPVIIGTPVTVASNGTYSFANVTPNKKYQVRLIKGDTTTPYAAGIPASWAATAPITTANFNVVETSVTSKDFGIIQKAKVVIAKRITKIAGSTTNPNQTTNNNLTVRTADSFNFTVAKAPDAPANYAGNWHLTDSLVGLTDGGLVKPGDQIEYTIYFLNNQGQKATNVKICDQIRGNQTYVAGTLKLSLGGAAETAVSDGTNTYGMTGSPSSTAPTDCNSGATTITGVDNGGVWISRPDIDGATGVGTPATSYGYFKFTTKVKE